MAFLFLDADHSDAFAEARPIACTEIVLKDGKERGQIRDIVLQDVEADSVRIQDHFWSHSVAVGALTLPWLR